MNPLFLPIRRAGCAWMLAATAAVALAAQTTPTPLGLPRLKSSVAPADAAPLAAGKFAVDALATQEAPGLTRSQQNGADYLAMNANQEWTRPLRGSSRDVSFVSFSLYASVGTVIQVGNAWLGVTESPTTAGLQLMAGEPTAKGLAWRPLPFNVGKAVYGGKTLAPLSVLTLRLDPAAGVFDVYYGARLLATDLPLQPDTGNRQLLVRAGNQGAWLSGLVMSDENPIYEDANANGVDDGFEKQQLGGRLLPLDGDPANRQALLRQWQEAQRVTRPAAFAVQPLLSDGATTPSRPKS